MDINTLGLTAAAAAFLGIWTGHVMVRKVEFVSPHILPPVLAFLALGAAAEYFSLVVEGRHLQTALGVLGATLLWDALEVARQQGRVRKGHAPANPKNPRHAALLSAPGSRATTVDLLKREPRKIQWKE